jgi:PIN domain nuclease of toxin-antitoxin system
LILLDTHIALWLSADPERISIAAQRAIARARKTGETLAICDISFLEFAMLVRKRRLQMSMSLDVFLDGLHSRFTVIPIAPKACSRITALPAGFPKDPADQIIAATALAEGIPLITADRAIRESRAVRTIW